MRILVAAAAILVLATSAFAWRDNVHRALALFSLQHLTGGYGHADLDRNLFKTDSIYPLRMHSPAGLGTYLSAFADGCVSQDCEDLFGTGIISLNHFYNPITNSGLSDLPLGVHVGFNSMHWAYRGSLNSDCWVSARQRYYQALTSPTVVERTEAAREMFFDLGNVAHLIQDLAQPQHTRNDAHLDESSGDWGIEQYAETEFGSMAAIRSLYTPSPSGSSKPLIGIYPPPPVVSQIDPSIPVEFQWLWDTNDYTGQPLFESSLTYYDIVLPYNNGLAELTNFFFPTTDTLFSYTNAILLSGGRKVPYFDEVRGSHFPSRRQFRYPRIGDSNLMQTLSTQWPWGVEHAISRGKLQPGQPVDTIRLMFPSYLAPNGGYPSVSASWSSISNLPNSNFISKQGQLFFRDSDYRNICKAVLPYAVDYASLMVGVFFRGDLTPRLFEPAGYEPYHVLSVENSTGRTSGSPLGTLRGGSWELYQTDAAGVRTKRTIPVSEYAGELGYFGDFDLQFFPKPWLGEDFTLVFKGQIGTEREAVTASSFTLALSGMEGRVSTNNVFASVGAVSGFGGTLGYQDSAVEVWHDGSDPGSLTLGPGTAEFTRKATLVDHGQTVRSAKGTVTVRLEDKVDNTSGSMKSDVIRISFSGLYTDQQGGACTWSTTLTNMPNGWVSPICDMVP